ncbi:hypothetical protein OTU49_004616 [Cherax quadricarinatus]|uniref:Uncharacterized protein n=1 Tax=Cherax quadricarinatus TaxID=27406 RepID=A0AAW0WWK9_CHEQU
MRPGRREHVLTRPPPFFFSFLLPCQRALDPADMSEKKASIMEKVKKFVSLNKRALTVCAVAATLAGAGYYHFCYQPDSQASDSQASDSQSSDSQSSDSQSQKTEQDLKNSEAAKKK